MPCTYTKLGNCDPRQEPTQSEPVAPWQKRETSAAPPSSQLKGGKSKRRLQCSRACGSQVQTALKHTLVLGPGRFSTARCDWRKNSMQKAKLNGTPDACTSEPLQAARKSCGISPTKARKQCAKQRSIRAQCQCSKPRKQTPQQAQDSQCPTDHLRPRKLLTAAPEARERKQTSEVPQQQERQECPEAAKAPKQLQLRAQAKSQRRPG